MHFLSVILSWHAAPRFAKIPKVHLSLRKGFLSRQNILRFGQASACIIPTPSWATRHRAVGPCQALLNGGLSGFSVVGKKAELADFDIETRFLGISK